MPKLYEALAEAFLAEGVDTQFVLMGDGNMHWSTAFSKLPGVLVAGLVPMLGDKRQRLLAATALAAVVAMVPMNCTICCLVGAS